MMHSARTISVLLYDSDDLDREIISYALTDEAGAKLWPNEEIKITAVNNPKEFHRVLVSRYFDVAVVGLHGVEPHRELSHTGFLDERTHIPTVVCADVLNENLLLACSKQQLWTLISKSELVPRLRDAVHYLATTVKATESQGSFTSLKRYLNEVFPLLLHDSDDGYLAVSDSGEVVFSNKAARNLLGRTSLSKSDCGFLLGGSNSVFEISVLVESQEKRIACFSHPLLIDHHLVYLVRLEDISWHFSTEEQIGRLEKSLAEKSQKIRVREQRIAELESEIQAVLRAKDGFFATISHEIRTPLSSVLGYAEALISEAELQEDYKKKLSVILTSGNYLLQLVNNALDISKLEAGKLQTKSEACSLEELVHDVHDIMAARAEEKGLELKVNFEFPVPSRFFSDFTRLKQILCNLVGNAIKFTEIGEVVLCVNYDISYDELVFEVKDTGMGVPEGQKDLIFEVYQQSTTTSGSIYGGSGLGLPLSKQLAECLGGTLTVRTNSPRGSIFTCSIRAGIDQSVPMLRDVQDVQGPSKEQTFTGDEHHGLSGRVLIVEDYDFTRNLARLFVTGFGLTVVEAKDGEEALQTAREQGPFDLILMDMRMPKMDGYQAVSKLRESGDKTPIIAFTANTYNEEIKQARDVGCDDYLAKPFSKNGLYRIIKQYLGSESLILSPFKLPDEIKNDDAVEKLVKDFQASLRLVREEVLEAWESRDTNKLKGIIHKLRASQAFGFIRLSEEARKLQGRLESAKQSDIELFVEVLQEAMSIEVVQPESIEHGRLSS